MHKTILVISDGTEQTETLNNLSEANPDFRTTSSRLWAAQRRNQAPSPT
jgi:hypothetical protein